MVVQRSVGSADTSSSGTNQAHGKVQVHICRWDMGCDLVSALTKIRDGYLSNSGLPLDPRLAGQDGLDGKHLGKRGCHVREEVRAYEAQIL